MANGRRRKCQIERLQTARGVISEQVDLPEHIYEFYRNLFGPEPRGSVRLHEGVWSQKGSLSDSQRECMTRPFSVEEVEAAIKDMKTETAPGPDGFPVIFYKKFWGLLKWWIMEMVEDFYKGKLDLKRLNYGVITLIPKVVEAASIKQYRPICLLNVFYKLFTKLLAVRLGRVADDIISKT